MTKKILLLAGFLLMATVAQAVPAKPGVKRSVTLADGRVVELTLHGDEHFSYYTDSEGTPCLLRKGKLEKKSTEAIAELWSERREKRLQMSSEETRAAKGKLGIGTAGRTTGNHRGLVILIQFTDVSFVTESPKETFNRFFNETGYNYNGMAGSVKDYFLAQSYNQLNIDFDVVGPYTAANEMAYYGAPNGDNHDTRPEYLMAEAVDAASADVDFRNYDWNEDGTVDQVFVVFAGYNQAQGADENTIWPHEYSLAASKLTRTYNGVTINTYGCSSELSGNGRYNTGMLDGIGTACHEFSHCLGLPDMYDTQGNNYAMAYWDVMCAGSYNDNSCTPAGYTSYERWFSGWMEPVEINEMTRVSDMKPLVEEPQAYVLYNDKNRNEYYLLENRQPVGFDRGLYGHGMLILHVDYNEGAWASNSVNTSASRQRMTIIAADNTYVQTVSSMAGDTWPGTSGNTALTNYTTPAATLYNNNTDGTKLMSKPIDNITEDEEAMTVSFVACRPELGIPSIGESTATAGENAFTVTWPAVSGAIGYELELTAIGSASTDPSEALQWEQNFSGCYSKTTGYSDISSNLSKYGLSGWKGSKLFTSPYNLKIGTSSTAGYICTPSWWSVPSSLELTFVMGAAPFAASGTVRGTLQLESAISGGSSSDIVTSEVPFEVTGDGKQVFTFTVPKQNDLYRLTISPSSQMYLNYLSLYDGTWTAEQLGINSSLAPRRSAADPVYFQTSTNSFEFTGLDTSNRYIYRIRSLGEEGTYSQWSDEKMFEFDPSSIGLIEIGSDTSVRYYDLQGREVSAGTQGLLIVKEGDKEIRKVFVPSNR